MDKIYIEIIEENERVFLQRLIDEDISVGELSNMLIQINKFIQFPDVMDIDLTKMATFICSMLKLKKTMNTELYQFRLYGGITAFDFNIKIKIILSLDDIKDNFENLILSRFYQDKDNSLYIESLSKSMVEFISWKEIIYYINKSYHELKQHTLYREVKYNNLTIDKRPNNENMDDYEFFGAELLSEYHIANNELSVNKIKNLLIENFHENFEAITLSEYIHSVSFYYYNILKKLDKLKISKQENKEKIKEITLIRIELFNNQHSLGTIIVDEAKFNELLENHPDMTDGYDPTNEFKIYYKHNIICEEEDNTEISYIERTSSQLYEEFRKIDLETTKK